VNDLGEQVQWNTTTDASGAYAFSALRPGTYTISETQPTGYDQGTNTAGSLGGTVSGDQISTINVSVSAQGVHYDFGEVLQAVHPPARPPDLPGPTGIPSKFFLIGRSWADWGWQ